MKPWGSAGLLLSFAVLSGPSAAAIAGKVTVYSNICFNKEAGDALGSKIILLDLGNDDFFALYEEAQGEDGELVGQPLDPDAVKDFKRGRLEFDISYGGRDMTIAGTVSQSGILLTKGGLTTTTGETSREPIRLPRIALPETRPSC